MIVEVDGDVEGALVDRDVRRRRFRGRVIGDVEPFAPKERDGALAVHPPFGRVPRAPGGEGRRRRSGHRCGTRLRRGSPRLSARRDDDQERGGGAVAEHHSLTHWISCALATGSTLAHVRTPTSPKYLHSVEGPFGTDSAETRATAMMKKALLTALPLPGHHGWSPLAQRGLGPRGRYQDRHRHRRGHLGFFAFTSPQNPDKLVLIMNVHAFAFSSSRFSNAVDYKFRIRPIDDAKTLAPSTDARREPERRVHVQRRPPLHRREAEGHLQGQLRHRDRDRRVRHALAAVQEWRRQASPTA